MLKNHDFSNPGLEPLNLEVLDIKGQVIVSNSIKSTTCAVVGCCISESTVAVSCSRFRWFMFVGTPAVWWPVSPKTTFDTESNDARVWITNKQRCQRLHPSSRSCSSCRRRYTSRQPYTHNVCNKILCFCHVLECLLSVTYTERGSCHSYLVIVQHVKLLPSFFCYYFVRWVKVCVREVCSYNSVRCNWDLSAPTGGAYSTHLIGLGKASKKDGKRIRERLNRLGQRKGREMERWTSLENPACTTACSVSVYFCASLYSFWLFSFESFYSFVVRTLGMWRLSLCMNCVIISYYNKQRCRRWCGMWPSFQLLRAAWHVEILGHAQSAVGTVSAGTWSANHK